MRGRDALEFGPRGGFALQYRLRCGSLRSRRAEHTGKAAEEIVSNLLGGTVDQALTDLRELAADVCVCGVGKGSSAFFRGQQHFSVSFCKTGHAALTLARKYAA